MPPRLRYRVALLVYRQIVVLNYLLLASVLYYIPWIGPFLSLLHLCWITSFYSFDYRWNIAGLTLQQRVDNVEGHWAYYIGFGS
jgi:hypothetical protein